MSEKQIQINYRELADSSGLSEKEQKLVQDCIEFSANAYAPYSQFDVSAVVELEDGTIVKGTNVENASYPVAICAERNLLSHVISNYPTAKIKSMYIYADADIGGAISPCGLCRQSIVEAEERQGGSIQLYLIAKNGQILVIEKGRDLLPLHFDGKFLKNG